METEDRGGLSSLMTAANTLRYLGLFTTIPLLPDTALTNSVADAQQRNPQLRCQTIDVNSRTREAMVGQLFPALFMGTLVAMAMQSHSKS